ncbi:MAG: SsrA-binding protein SmpB [Deltaproteobacteria bacterium]|nr:SsrA-binding protein SmpB [Deltaproteobacteria bacterium]
MAKKKKTVPGIICDNKRVARNYDIDSTFEAGIVLEGTEVKSIRDGRINLTDAYANIKNGEAWLFNLNIALYDKARHFNHETKRVRKLLLHKKEIEKLTTKVKERGFTLIPIDLHFKEGRVKVTLGLAKGKKQWDNRQEIMAKQERREMRGEAPRRS